MSSRYLVKQKTEKEKQDEMMENILSGVLTFAIGAGAAYLGYKLYQHVRNEKISPAQIQFSQDTVKSTFQDGQHVNDLIFAIAAKKTQVDDIPLIEVLEDNGTYISRDNRRLYVFRVLNLMGILPGIDVQVVGEGRESTSKSDGCHLERVRNDTTYQHCMCKNFSGLPEWWDNNRRKVKYDMQTPQRMLQLDYASNAISRTASANDDACIVM